MIESLLTLFVVGLVLLLGIGIAMAVVSFLFHGALAIAGFLLFKVVPIVLLGYLLLRFLRPRHKRLSGTESDLLS